VALTAADPGERRTLIAAWPEVVVGIDDEWLQQPGTGVKTQAQLPVGWATLVDRLDPQRPLCRLDCIL
jgi:hypothetical protein